MRRHLRVAALTLALPVWPGTAWPQADDATAPGRIEAELIRCRAIADSLARIVCYDAIVLPRAAAVRAPLAPTAPAPRTATAAAAAAPAASAVAAAPASAPTATASAELAREFGLPERAAVQAVQFIDSAIAGDFDGWLPQARLQLANGQVWEIADGSTGTYALMRNPKVRISRGMLGSFFLSIDGVAQVPRVRRLR